MTDDLLHVRLGLAAVQHGVTKRAVEVLVVHLSAQACFDSLLSTIQHLSPHGLVLGHPVNGITMVLSRRNSTNALSRWADGWRAMR